jgi:CBS domain-containing protein
MTTARIAPASAFAGLTVADAAVTMPKTHPPDTTLAQISAFFTDDHVHAVLITDSDSRLLAMLERADLGILPPTSARAAPLGQLSGRTILPATPLSEAHEHLLRARRRRLAVTDPDGTLLGLLCLKRNLAGFCTDQDLASRALGTVDLTAPLCVKPPRSERKPSR